MLKKFIKFIKFILVNWNYLSNDVRSELVDFMNYYYDLTLVSKYKEDIK